MFKFFFFGFSSFFSFSKTVSRARSTTIPKLRGTFLFLGGGGVGVGGAPYMYMNDTKLTSKRGTKSFPRGVYTPRTPLYPPLSLIKQI
jgi:hypothetical protein